MLVRSLTFAAPCDVAELLFDMANTLPLCGDGERELLLSGNLCQNDRVLATRPGNLFESGRFNVETKSFQKRGPPSSPSCVKLSLSMTSPRTSQPIHDDT